MSYNKNLLNIYICIVALRRRCRDWDIGASTRVPITVRFGVMGRDRKALAPRKCAVQKKKFVSQLIVSYCIVTYYNFVVTECNVWLLLNTVLNLNLNTLGALAALLLSVKLLSSLYMKPFFAQLKELKKSAYGIIMKKYIYIWITLSIVEAQKNTFHTNFFNN